MWWRLRCPPPAARGRPAGWRAALLGVPGTRVPAALGAGPPRRQAPPCPAVHTYVHCTVEPVVLLPAPRGLVLSSPLGVVTVPRAPRCDLARGGGGQFSVQSRWRLLPLTQSSCNRKTWDCALQWRPNRGLYGHRRRRRRSRRCRCRLWYWRAPPSVRAAAWRHSGRRPSL